MSNLGKILNTRNGHESELTAPMNEFVLKPGQDIDQEAANNNRRRVRRVRSYLEYKTQVAAAEARKAKEAKQATQNGGGEDA